MGVARAGPAAVRLLIVAEEVGVNDRQAAGDIHLHADRDEVAQEHADSGARHDHAELRVSVAALDDAVNHVGQADKDFDEREKESADERHHVNECEQKDSRPARVFEHLAPTHHRRAEVRLGRAAGEDVGVGAAAFEEWRAATCEPLLNARCLFGIDHPDGFSGFVVAEAEGGDDLLDAIEQFALHAGCGRGEAGVKRVDLAMLARQQSA